MFSYLLYTLNKNIEYIPLIGYILHDNITLCKKILFFIILISLNFVYIFCVVKFEFF